MTIGIYGGSAAFISFLEALAPVRVFRTPRTAVSAATAGELGALFLLPRYQKKERAIPTAALDSLSMQEALSRLRAEGFPVFIENYEAFTYTLYDIVGISLRRFSYPMTQKYVVDEENGALLQVRCDRYYTGESNLLSVTGRGARTLFSVSDGIGTHRMLAECGERTPVAVQNDCFLFFGFSYTDYDGRFRLPYTRFRASFSKIFSEFLSLPAEKVGAAFDAAFGKSRIGTAYPMDKVFTETERTAAVRELIERAIGWHLRSGIMEKADGSRGIFEMLDSDSLSIARNMRGDSCLQTAGFFATAGQALGRGELVAIAERMADYFLFERGGQYKEGKNEGYFHWFSSFYGVENRVKNYYPSDSARGGVSLLRLYEVTGKERYLTAAKALGEGFLRVHNGSPDGIYHGIEFYERPVAFLAALYKVTGDRRYLDQVHITATHYMADAANFRSVAAHSKMFSLARQLGLLVFAAEVDKETDYAPVINDLLSFFCEIQHKVGGISSVGAYIPKDIKTDMEFAIGFGGEEDAIADNLYCTASILQMLRVLRRIRLAGVNHEKVEGFYRNLVDFCLRTQIVSDDPKLDGAYMRAFDMENGEYYGCHKDVDWGPYCVMSGWVMGDLPQGLLDEL